MNLSPQQNLKQKADCTTRNVCGPHRGDNEVDNKCHICNSEAKREPVVKVVNIDNVDCLRCGKYRMGGTAEAYLDKNIITQSQRANLSGWIRENQGVEILYPDLERLLHIETPSTAEIADKLLVYLSKQYPRPGQRFVLEFKDRKECLLYQALTYAIDMPEVYYFFRTYLGTAKHYLDTSNLSTYFITPEGWAHIESKRQLNPKSNIAFVAMWFDKSMEALWQEGIEPGVLAAGYKPLRIDKKEHLNKIDDEIIAGIRKSRFVVADFTGERGGVYFEAGYALGLGLRVVWLCKKEELDKVHFDTRQYNFIIWEDGKWDELRSAIKNRIEAAIGHGSYKLAPDKS